MKELTIEKLVPLLTSPVWYKRLVGEYYEILIRCERVRKRILISRDKMRTLPALHTMVKEKEIELMSEQFYSMKQYSDILYHRLALYGIPYVDILSGVLNAADVLEGEEE